MKSLASRRALSSGIVFALVAFGLINAGVAMVSSKPAQPISLTSTQQIVSPTGETGTALTAASR